MMRIVMDDIIYDLQVSGGISTYWSELGARLGEESVLHLRRRGAVRNVVAERVERTPRTLIPDLRGPVRLRQYLPVLIPFKEPFIFHSSYYRYAVGRSALNVTTIHDFIYERLRSGAARLVHHGMKTLAVRHSVAVICVSEATMADFKTYYPDYIGTVRVIHNGISEEFHPLPTVRRRRQVLFVGGRSRYKNFSRVVDAVAALPEYTLVAAGGRRADRRERAECERKLPGRVVFTGPLPAAELNRLYNESSCLVYPSEMEGFGVPVGEAMRAGCPVVAGDASAVVEVGKDAVAYAGNGTSRDIAAVIRRLQDEGFRDGLVSRGFARASELSWDVTARMTRELYQEIMDACRPAPAKGDGKP